MAWRKLCLNVICVFLSLLICCSSPCEKLLGNCEENPPEQSHFSFLSCGRGEIFQFKCFNWPRKKLWHSFCPKTIPLLILHPVKKKVVDALGALEMGGHVSMYFPDWNEINGQKFVVFRNLRKAPSFIVLFRWLMKPCGECSNLPAIPHTEKKII